MSFLDTRRGSAAALALYAALSIAVFGFPALRDPQGSVVGSFGADQGFFMWSLVHWKLVLLDGAHPFLNHDIYAPGGFNLAWATVIPGPGLLLVPITATLGPVVSYNLLALAAPALAGWTMFLLARELTRNGAASLAAGYVFGFSSYMLGQTLNHVNLALVFPIPLAILLAVRHARGELETRRYVIYLTLVAIAQFLIFLEVLMTAVLAGALALGLSLLFAGPAQRSRIWVTAGGAALALGLMTLVMSPYLYFALAHPNPIHEGLQPHVFLADAENFFFPTQVTWLGSGSFAEISGRFAGNLTEQLAYLPLPIIAIVLAYGFASRASLTARVLLASAAIVTICALGERLTVGGEPAFRLPWHLADHFPLIRLALPARFVLYLWVAVALMVGLWLAARPRSPWRWALVAAGIVMLLPNPHGGWWRTEEPVPAFFANGTYRKYLTPGETVVVIPYGVRGNSMYWQATTDNYFKMAGGYAAAVVPDTFSSYPTTYRFYSGQSADDGGADLRRFIHDKGVTSIIVQRDYPGAWRELLAPLGVKPLAVDDVLLYRLPRG